MTALLLLLTALINGASDSPDWALANTLLAEHERNAALVADCTFAFKEFRKQKFFASGVETDAEVEALVEVARSGENLLVRRNETTNVKRRDGSLYTMNFDLVKNADYTSYFTYPGTQLELFYHNRPGPSFDPHRAANAIPRALGVGPHKCGFGDGHSILAGILQAAQEASSELTCKPVQEGQPLYALEITRPTGVVSRIILDLSKGALIVSAVKIDNGHKHSVLEVVPARYGEGWFPKSWKRILYDKDGMEKVVSSADLANFSQDTSEIRFTFETILPSEDMPVVVYDEAGSLTQMYSVDGVLVDRELVGIVRGEKKVPQTGG